MAADHAPHTAAALAARFDLGVRGDATVAVTGVAPLTRAGPTELAFLSNPRYRPQLAHTTAGIVVMREADADSYAGTALIARDPYVAYAKIAALFEPAANAPAGVHPSAVIDPSAVVDATASIGPQVCIGANTRVGAGTRIGPGCVIGDDCVIGDGCELVARVTLVTRVRLGQRVTIHPGAVLGAAGFGLAMDAGHWINVPQLGGVVIGDDCDIGANTTIDRGALDDTVIEEDVRLDNLIQIGHNVRIGAHSALAGCVGVAGSTRIGRYCLLAGKAGVAGHLDICDKVVIHAMTMVSASITEPGEYSSGIPAQPTREWRKNAVRIRQLDSLARRIGGRAKGEE
ncbi:UDP-3-O-(3-hydroxymyristoyl)glucosamine N-acyltransferase [Luteimonas sp. BDR2-5]|uniref:UDP-3-O-(3-hydroxymyristoyl)glucosamine N-acyltransferase n=1 Tax=Proluteimonas luteida TaxID=2878685 RepID=UPI001E603920|nr:UDP-3-O-(3-hydroxymyristoyl)glucosamine N-acyltransferase [Luteimonas sp. BDR2-5]MCD9028120.1 UDP-3-O-(3-hydroxymyristoyl)glucosamine N-acyltransferase [Luteimonas sp. BDR2-5]